MECEANPDDLKRKHSEEEISQCDAKIAKISPEGSTDNDATVNGEPQVEATKELSSDIMVETAKTTDSSTHENIEVQAAEAEVHVEHEKAAIDPTNTLEESKDTAEIKPVESHPESTVVVESESPETKKERAGHTEEIKETSEVANP